MKVCEQLLNHVNNERSLLETEASECRQNYTSKSVICFSHC